VGEDPDPVREDAELHVLIVEQGMGWMGGLPYEAGVGADIVESMTYAPPYLYSLSGSIPEPLAAVLSPAGIDNIQGYLPVLYGEEPLANGALALAVDEERLKDQERNHPSEQLSWLVLGAPIAEPEPEIAELRERPRERQSAPAGRSRATGVPQFEHSGKDMIFEWPPGAGGAAGADWELWESHDLRSWRRNLRGLREAASTGIDERDNLRFRAPLLKGLRQGYFRWRLVPKGD
jgi:hypothetical protein